MSENEIPWNETSQKSEKWSFLPDVLQQNATKIMCGIALALTIALIATCNSKNSDIESLQSEKDSLLLVNAQRSHEIEDLKKMMSWNSLDAKQRQDSLERVIQFQKTEYERRRDNVLEWIYDAYAKEEKYFWLWAFEFENLLSQAIRDYYPEGYKANPDSTFEVVKQELADKKKKRDEKLNNYKKKNNQPKGKNQNTQRTTHK